MSKELWSSVKGPAHRKIEFVEEYAIGSTLLDVGCAQGWYSKRAQEKGMEVLATDLDNFMVVDGIPFMTIHPDQIDPRNGKKYDTVVMFDVLEHIKDEEAAMQELVDVGARRVLLSVPKKDDKNLEDYNLTLVSRRDTTHQRYYTEDYLHDLFGKYGFKIIRLEEQGAVLPGIIGEYIRPRVLGKLATNVVNKLLFAGIFKSPYFGDFYVVAERMS